VTAQVSAGFALSLFNAAPANLLSASDPARTALALTFASNSGALSATPS